MYVSIDLNKMAFCGKHEDHRVLCNLNFIYKRLCDLFPITWTGGLKHRTDMELQMLYRNTTGESPVYHGDDLRKILFGLMERLPTTEARLSETERQANYLEKKNKDSLEGYAYAKGAELPSKPKNGPVDECLKASISEEEIAAILRGRPVSAQQATQDKTCPPAATTTAPQPARAPRSGGAREVIWKVADELWSKNGSPSEKNAILAVRKRVMDILESDHGIKRTSASSELGNWQKARI